MSANDRGSPPKWPSTSLFDNLLIWQTRGIHQQSWM